jgi:hypothetical protein
MAPPSREISARQMNLADSVKPPTDLMSGRFFLIGYLPTYAAAGFPADAHLGGGAAHRSTCSAWHRWSCALRVTTYRTAGRRAFSLT